MANSARQTAFAVLLKIEKDKAYSNLAIDSAVRASEADSTDCAFISRLVYGVTERKLTLDFAFSRYLKQPLSKLRAEVLTALRLGTYQILYMDKVPDSAAVNESVALVRNNGCAYAAGLVNAVLRKVADVGVPDFSALPVKERISVLYSVPQELVDLISYHYGEENAEAFFKASLEPKKITIRVNTLKTTTEKIKKIFDGENVRYEDCYVENALVINTPCAVYELYSYNNGLFHVEDISSQLCVKVLAPKPGETVVDVCSAPGGKSFTAAQYMNDNGTLISCDLHGHRAALVGDGARRLGINSLKALVNDATVFNPEFPEADAVLCDVPCSGLGIIGKKPEIKYKKLDDIKELIPVQKKILETSSRYVKNGGRLVYSTCSVNPNENRKVCDWFLKEHPEFHSIPALPEVERVKQEDDYLTLMPHINNCDGFFVSLFVKD